MALTTNLYVNGNNSNSLLFTNVQSSDIRTSEAETEMERKRRENREKLLAEIKRRTEENEYRV